MASMKASILENEAQRTIERLREGRHKQSPEGPVPSSLLRLQQDPNDIEQWLKLAQIFLDQHDAAEAADCYWQAIRIRPEDAHSLAMLGIALAREGKLKEAEDQLRRSLELDPRREATHYNLAVCLAEQGRFTEAESSLRQALRLSPDYFEAHRSLSRVLNSLGRRAEAVEHCRRAIAFRPRDTDLLTELGAMLALDGRSAEEAAVILKHAVRLSSAPSDTFNSLGLAQMAAGRFAEAEASYDRALALDPGFASAHSNLGTNYKEQGRLREAVACYDIALGLDPDSVSTHWNRALALLQAGDYERGWAEYEWRWRRETSPPRPFRRPMWDGSELGGRRVLLWSEQGLGDTIQFLRYSALVKERGGTVLFECPSPLASILRSCQGIDAFYVEGEALPEFDFHMPLMSGPFLFGTSVATVPNRVPYLSADPQRGAHWRERIDAEAAGRMRIGIAWQGNPHHPLDRFRSATLEDLRPLTRIPGVRLFSVQRGPGTEQLDRWASDLDVVELTRRDVSGPDDWADTAAILENLDLVVTVDTAVAHLAGALGGRVWVALAASPDWRWMLKRGDSPWYRTTQLFRQQVLRDWRSVFADMAAELKWLAHHPRH
jgi:Tfp pilus assembly protein PilF